MTFTQYGYVYLGYGVVSVVLAGYSVRVIVRGRKLSRTLPPDERTWQ
jgi:CcmD family protein